MNSSKATNIFWLGSTAQKFSSKPSAAAIGKNGHKKLHQKPPENGCERWLNCLTCPFEKCYYDA